jgi:hypothetical protein
MACRTAWRLLLRASECLHLLEERTYRDGFATAGFDPELTWGALALTGTILAET